MAIPSLSLQTTQLSSSVMPQMGLCFVKNTHNVSVYCQQSVVFAHIASWLQLSKLYWQCLLLFQLYVWNSNWNGFCHVSWELQSHKVSVHIIPVWSFCRVALVRQGVKERERAVFYRHKKDYYKEWTAYLFFISTFKLFMQPFCSKW